MASEFITSGNIISGVNALLEAAGTIKLLGKKALIVTDSTMCKLGNLDKVTKLLEEQNILYAIDAGINKEPDDSMILHGTAMFLEEKCDCLIALGGGSPIDAMKAIGILTTFGGVLEDYIGKPVDGKLSPMIAIPTTAGTGSEATQFTIITNQRTQVKMLLKGQALMPDLAIIDPMFTITAPKTVTAATGVDALTHAIEAYTSKKAQPLSDTLAISACQRIFHNLKLVWEDGTYVEGRVQMSLAAIEAGMAFNNSSVTIVHGMSRPIGALFHVPHGMANAILLNICLKYIVDGALDRLAELSRKCGIASESETEAEAAFALIRQVKQLLKDIQIPTLESFGIEKVDFWRAIPKMAKDAAASGSPANTRRDVTEEAMEILYQKLWEGEAGL